jgi:putative ABC transport system permease protein
MSAPHTISPPRWPLTILRFFIKKEYLEEIEGDMEELFYDNLARGPVAKAKRIYTLEVLKLLRPVLLKKLGRSITLPSYPMYRNYFKTSLRGLVRNPLTAFINVFGLSVAIGICLIVYAFMLYDHSIDQFHANKHALYLATFTADHDGERHDYGMTPRPLGARLQQDFAQVKNMCRVEESSVVIKHKDNVFHEKIRYVDPSFLDMFTFPLKWGAPHSLSDLSSIILSEDMAVKYFGDANPLGLDVWVIFNDTTKKAFKVSGVAAAFPKSHDLDFDFLVHFDNVKVANRGYDADDWSAFLPATFIQVENTAGLQAIEAQMKSYLTLQHEAQPERPVTAFSFEPLTTLHERAANLRDAIVHDYNIEGRLGMPIIAIFMIALACFNYINIAIVSASKRLKEIGVRKVIGANRRKVVVQFLSENIVVTFFAGSIGIILCYFIFLPWFVQFTGWPLELPLLHGNLWVFLIALLLFTAVVSGLYPALYVSTFDAVKIFRGSLRFGKHNPFTRVFLGVQLILAFMTITAGVVFTQNNVFQNNRSWGYDQKHVVYANVPDAAAFDRLLATMKQQPGVVASAGSADHLGKTMSPVLLRRPAHPQYEAGRIAIDAHYLETMGVRLIAGRGFHEDSENDRWALVVNELLVRELQLTQPLGQMFELNGVSYEIIGVVQDFHHRSFFNPIEPTVFTLATHDDFRYLSLRVEPGAEEKTHQALQQQWAKLYPEIPFQGGYQADTWGTYFHSVTRSETFNKVIASVAVLLASLGLYGLVTLNVSGRIKEFSIRKMLGAGARNIAAGMFRQYAVLVTVSLLIGAPLSYLFAQAYLDMLFAYPMPMDYSGTLIALAILACIVLGVIATQIRRVLHVNSVEGLKIE